METINLDTFFAYVSGKPIRFIDQVPETKRPLLKTNSPDPDWQNRIDEQWWGKKQLAMGITTRLGNGKLIDPRFVDLNRILLSFAGAETCFPGTEEDMEDILKYGQLWLGDRSIIRKGERSRCHSNTCGLWLASKDTCDVAIATGYALSKDGVWRQHTWLLNRKPRSVQVVETTERRVCYYGFVLTDQQAQTFVCQNL